MKKTVLLTSKDKKSTIKVEGGELISFQKDGIEYLHQKGNKGWSNTDTEMFPIIGPTEKNNYVVNTKKGQGKLDQHGLLRCFNYTLISQTENSLVYTKVYEKNKLISNPKFPKKSKLTAQYWPYNFEFQKKYTLNNDSLIIHFELKTEDSMPFMLGYHPAFLLNGLNTEYLKTNDKKITITEVINSGAGAFPVLETTSISLHQPNKKTVEISTNGFNNFMLWTEVNNMICIEPITQYISKNQVYSEENMRICKEKETFSVTIRLI